MVDMWHIMEKTTDNTWKVVSPSGYGYTSFERATQVMRAKWYGGEAPQDFRFAIVLWPMV